MEGLVLRRTDYGESDQILKVFLKEKGTVSAIAKGIRRSKRRFPHHLEPFRLYRFKLARKKKGQDLFLIQSADQLHDFEGIKEDIRKIALGNFIQELVLIAVREENPHPHLYAFITRIFQTLCETDTIFPLWFYAMIHIMRHLGFSPSLETCLKCKKPLQKQDMNRFDPSGGVVCPHCVERFSGASLVTLSSEALSALQFLNKSTPQAARRLQLSADARECIQSCLLDFVTYHLERPIKSLAFLKEVTASSPIP